MRIMKPGEPCPCCGAPIRGDLLRWKLLLLSYIAEGLSLMDAISAMAEVMEFPPPDAVLERQTERRAGEQERYANNIDNLPENPERVPDEIPGGQTWVEEKRAIVQRLMDYREAHGLGCLARVSQKTAHRKNPAYRRIPSEKLPPVASQKWRCPSGAK